jgi:acid phosphatase/lysosomal acid phosphatase/prostatic aicd phosphatase
MEYLLGLRNRKKYIEKEKFLSEKFDAHEILIYSSNLNRTMLSASSQLQGLFLKVLKKEKY